MYICKFYILYFRTTRIHSHRISKFMFKNLKDLIEIELFCYKTSCSIKEIISKRKLDGVGYIYIYIYIYI